jgi:hypothetical protein
MKDNRSPWYDPVTEKSRLLAALDQLRRLCCSSEELLACARIPGSFELLGRLKHAIDDYAENETGHREYFWGRPDNAGCKHS